jgi:hypothetical protein
LSIFLKQVAIVKEEVSEGRDKRYKTRLLASAFAAFGFVNQPGSMSLV